MLQSVPGDDNEYLRAGRFVHVVLQRYVEACVKGKMESDAEAIQEIVEEEFDTAGLPEERYADLREAMLSFGEQPVDPGSVVALEKPFDVEIPGGGRFQGRIDRVNIRKDKDGAGILEIVDYKSSARMASETEIRGDLQLRLYRWVAMTHLFPGIEKVRWGIHYARYGSTRWGGEAVLALDIAKDNDAVEASLVRQWRRLHDTPVAKCKPEPGEICWEYGGCPVRLAGKCPAFTDAAVKKMAASDEVAENARAARELKDRLDAVVEKLKAAMQERPKIEVDGKDVGFHLTESSSFPLLGVWDLSTRKGGKLDGVALSKTEVMRVFGGKKAIDADEGLKAELALLEQKTPATRFTY